MTNSFTENPFKVFTPEDMSTKDVVDRFVRVSDFNKVYDSGHLMLNGPRGSGKSMLFRFLMPDCQMEEQGLTITELPFFAVLVSIKNTMPNLTELRRLDDRMAQTVLSEHALTSFVGSKLFKSLLGILPEQTDEAWSAPTQELCRSVLKVFPIICATDPRFSEIDCSSADSRKALEICRDVCDRAYSYVSQYAKRITFPDASLAYAGDLCDFLTFLYPAIETIRTLPYFPEGSPVYLLVDDADQLTLDQTRVLNSWLSTRTQNYVSIKVSTQYGYKSLLSISGQMIQSPHDYQEIDIADVYTSKKSQYRNNVFRILNRRLDKASYAGNAESFFPTNASQEANIREVEQRLRERWKQGKGRGNKPSDDAVRYARPDYIKQLGGISKSRSTYSYSGFDHLVHISSGQVRYVLQAAATMFDEQKAKSGTVFNCIEPGIQNTVLRHEADALMFSELDSLENNPSHSSGHLTEEQFDDHQHKVMKLRNLISFLGSIFFDKLISDDSERRVFSVAVSGDADKDVEEIFQMGFIHGYFHKSSVGRKDGTGRTRLFILTRRLAPHFGLDPSSFAGYQFLTNDILRKAMNAPNSARREFNQKKHRSRSDDSQRELFDENDIEN